MTGSLCVLNVGAGDIEVVFNQHDTGERDRALTMLKDMLARGYAILVRLDDGSYVRAKELDVERGRYIVQLPEHAPAVAASEPEETPKRRGRPPKRSIAIERAHAVGVARSAGG